MNDISEIRSLTTINVWQLPREDDNVSEHRATIGLTAAVRRSLPHDRHPGRAKPRKAKPNKGRRESLAKAPAVRQATKRSKSVPNSSGRATLRKTTSRVASPAPGKVSKDELRARIDKLERANMALRVKNKDLTKSLREADARADQLENELRLASQSAPRAMTTSKRTAGTGRAKRASATSRDPGNAVPPGVAVKTPEPLSEEDDRVRERLEELSPD